MESEEIIMNGKNLKFYVLLTQIGLAIMSRHLK